MKNMHRRPQGRNGRRQTSALRPHRLDNDRRRAPLQELPGRGRVTITGPGAVEFLRALETDGAA